MFDKKRSPESKQRSRSHVPWRGLVLIAPAALLLSGCVPSIVDPAGPIAAADNSIMIDSLAIMLAIIIPTIVATFAFAWWFRASNTRAVYRPDWEYSGEIEMVVWGIPLLVIVLLGGVAWIGSHDLDPAKPLPLSRSQKAIEIQAVSLDWKWLFIYPQQGVATLNKLIVPAGVPLHFSLTSASVLNTFFVPNFGSMIYTMNGMATELYLQSDKTGTFYGRSAHFSGDGFPGMEFAVDVVTPADYSAWAAQAKDSSSALDEERYLGLLEQSINDPPQTFKLADKALFAKIVTQKMPPGPGPVPAVRPKLSETGFGDKRCSVN